VWSSRAVPTALVASHVSRRLFSSWLTESNTSVPDRSPGISESSSNHLHVQFSFRTHRPTVRLCRLILIITNTRHHDTDCASSWMAGFLVVTLCFSFPDRKICSLRCSVTYFQLVERQEGHPSCKTQCWYVGGGDFTLHIVLVDTATSIVSPAARSRMV